MDVKHQPNPKNFSKGKSYVFHGHFAFSSIQVFTIIYFMECVSLHRRHIAVLNDIKHCLSVTEKRDHATYFPNDLCNMTTLLKTYKRTPYIFALVLKVKIGSIVFLIL